MSVLRKRSPWVLPAAGLVAGALALGLAGCGGGDSTPFPTVPTGPPISIPNPPTPTTQVVPTASQVQLVVSPAAAQVVHAPPVTDTSAATGSGGVQSVTVTVPAGALTRRPLADFRRATLQTSRFRSFHWRKAPSPSFKPPTRWPSRYRSC